VIAGPDINSIRVLEAAGRLKDFGFIVARTANNDTSPTYEINGLVQDAVKSYLVAGNGTEILDDILLGSLGYLSLIFPDAIGMFHEQTPLCRKYLPHAVKLLTHPKLNDAKVITSYEIELLEKVVDHARNIGDWEMALNVSSFQAVKGKLYLINGIK
jgi:hypothetical protein